MHLNLCESLCRYVDVWIRRYNVPWVCVMCVCVSVCLCCQHSDCECLCAYMYTLTSMRVSVRGLQLSVTFSLCLSLFCMGTYRYVV